MDELIRDRRHCQCPDQANCDVRVARNENCHQGCRQHQDHCRDLDADAQGPLLAHVDADVQRATHVAGSVLDRVVLGQILSAEQRCIPDVGLTLQQQRITRVRAAQKGAEGSLAVLLLDRIRLCNAENLPKLIMSGTPGLSNVAMVHLEIDWLWAATLAPGVQSGYAECWQVERQVL